MALTRRDLFKAAAALCAVAALPVVGSPPSRLIGTVRADEPGSWAVLCLDGRGRPIGCLARLDVYEDRLVGHQVDVPRLQAWADTAPDTEPPTNEVEVAQVIIDSTGRGFPHLWEAVGRFEHPQVTWSDGRNPGNLID